MKKKFSLQSFRHSLELREPHITCSQNNKTGKLLYKKKQEHIDCTDSWSSVVMAEYIRISFHVRFLKATKK